MMTGYSWEKRYVSGFLRLALDLMEVQAERTPEIERSATIIRKWLEKTFPTRKDEPEKIDIRKFSESLFLIYQIKSRRTKPHC